MWNVEVEEGWDIDVDVDRGDVVVVWEWESGMEEKMTGDGDVRPVALHSMDAERGRASTWTMKTGGMLDAAEGEGIGARCVESLKTGAVEVFMRSHGSISSPSFSSSSVAWVCEARVWIRAHASLATFPAPSTSSIEAGMKATPAVKHVTPFARPMRQRCWSDRTACPRKLVGEQSSILAGIRGICPATYTISPASCSCSCISA